MRTLDSIYGTVQAELTSGEIRKALALAASQGIILQNVEKTGELSVRFMLSAGDYRRLCRICSRRGYDLKCLQQKGIYWSICRLLKRPVLLVGLILILSFFLFLPGRVIFLEIEGNTGIPEMQIREAAEKSGIRFGISRRKLRSEDIKNRLLEKLPLLSWAGINTRGCVAILSVREHSPETKPEPRQGVSGIVAACDGTVDSCTVFEGTGLCRPGQAVSKGQLLISGYKDCGHSIQAGQAKGEVKGRTQRSLTVIFPRKYAVRMDKTGRKWNISLLIGKKYIKIPGSSGIPDVSCGRMYKEYCVTLPGGYTLPVTLIVETITDYETAGYRQTSQNMQKHMETFSEDYVCKQMLAGSVLQSEHSFTRNRNLFILTSQYLCREELGRRRQERIGE